MKSLSAALVAIACTAMSYLADTNLQTIEASGWDLVSAIALAFFALVVIFDGNGDRFP